MMWWACARSPCLTFRRTDGPMDGQGVSRSRISFINERSHIHVFLNIPSLRRAFCYRQGLLWETRHLRLWVDIFSLSHFFVKILTFFIFSGLTFGALRTWSSASRLGCAGEPSRSSPALMLATFLGGQPFSLIFRHSDCCLSFLWFIPICRKRSPYKWAAKGNIVQRNSVRLAEVRNDWFEKDWTYLEISVFFAVDAKSTWALIIWTRFPAPAWSS